MTWSSFHLTLPTTPDAFLAEDFPQWLDEELATGRVERFFFLLYSEGGYHLRLRFREPDGQPTAGLRQRLARAVERFLTARGIAEPFTLETRSYDREAHYFGQTPASVYAELLNESTSRLALSARAAVAPDDRARRWLVLAGLLRLAVDKSTRSPRRRAETLAAARVFTRELAERFDGLGPRETGAHRHDAWLERALPRVTTGLRDDPDLKRLGRLLARTRREVTHGLRISLHALHLLANKLGFTVREEFETYCTLERLHRHPLPSLHLRTAP